MLAAPAAGGEAGFGEKLPFQGADAEADGPRGKIRTIRSPLHFDGEIERKISAPPELGQDNAEYLGEG